MPSRSDDAVTRFLNVDLDIRGDANDVAAFLKSVEPSALVVNHADQFASMELAEPFASLEQTVLDRIPRSGAHGWDDDLILHHYDAGVSCAAFRNKCPQPAAIPS